LLHSEISEAFEEYRNGYGLTEIRFEGTKPEGIPIELADVVIRLLDMCYQFEIPLAAAILEKIRYNKTRPYRHGGKIA
jgi:NTP pyrophosphatase (non-canonical NTP hydrolase)